MLLVTHAIRNGGPFAVLALGAACLGLFLAIVALALAFLRSRAAVSIGFAALLLAVITGALGSVGTMNGRRTAEHALGDGVDGPVLSPVRIEQLRREGYAEARNAARVGLAGAAAGALVACAALAVAVARRTKDAPGVRGAAVASGALALAVLALGPAAALATAALPGRDLPDDSPIWDLLAAPDAIRQFRASHEALRDGVRVCRGLERALDRMRVGTSVPAQFSPDPHAWVSDLDELAAFCVDARIAAMEHRRQITNPVLAALEGGGPNPGAEAEGELTHSSLLVSPALLARAQAASAPPGTHSP